MGELNLTNAVASDLTNKVSDYSVPSATTDGAFEQELDKMVRVFQEYSRTQRSNKRKSDMDGRERI